MLFACVPIVAFGMMFGVRGGILAATFTVVVFLVWAALEGEPWPVEYAEHPLVCFGLGWLSGHYARGALGDHDLRRARANARLRDACAHGEVELVLPTDRGRVRTRVAGFRGPRALALQRRCLDAPRLPPRRRARPADDLDPDGAHAGGGSARRGQLAERAGAGLCEPRGPGHRPKRVAARCGRHPWPDRVAGRPARCRGHRRGHHLRRRGGGHRPCTTARPGPGRRRDRRLRNGLLVAIEARPASRRHAQDRPGSSSAGTARDERGRSPTGSSSWPIRSGWPSSPKEWRTPRPARCSRRSAATRSRATTSPRRSRRMRCLRGCANARPEPPLLRDVGWWGRGATSGDRAPAACSTADPAGGCALRRPPAPSNACVWAPVA